MRRLLVPALCCAIAITGSAQTSTLPPVQHLGPTLATSGPVYHGISVVRPLRNGTVLVDDVSGRQLLLVDTNFSLLKVVADTLPATDVQFGHQLTGVIPYLGDSTIFLETETPAMYMLDGRGNLGRSLAVPVPRDAGWMTQSLGSPWPSTDAAGRIIYRNIAPRPNGGPRPKPGDVIMVTFPDSAPIMRADPTTRTVETLAWYRTRKIVGKNLGLPDGTSMTYIQNNPTTSNDDFVVLSDGSLVILRADYHLDVMRGDGTFTSLPRIPYPWVHLTDSSKVSLIDSLRRAFEARGTSRPRSIGAGAAGGGGGGGMGSPPPGVPAATPDLVFPRPDELADYLPAFSTGAIRADANGRMWVHTLQAPVTPNTGVYDVITQDGRLAARVEIPDDHSIVGFDATSVYLAVRANGATHLERVKIP